MTSGMTVSPWIEKAMPFAPSRTATLMPISSPLMLSSGPPELPGLMSALVWIRFVSLTPFGSSILRSSALTMPAETVSS